VEHVDAQVTLKQLKASGAELGVNHTVPLVQRLFKAVEGLVEFTNMIRLSWVDVAFRLVNIDLFREISM